MKSFNHSTYLFLLLLIVLVMLIGFFCPLMVNDSNQFAVMAMRMVQEQDYFTLIKDTEEYLDKPHMHYWLAALSYEVFGMNQFAYRIPALLALLLGAYSCFGLGKLFYNQQAGWIVALLFLTAQTIVLSAIDVRTDAVLTGFAIFSIWQLMTYIEKGSWKPLLLGAFAAGVAFSTKGQIALVVIGMCVLVQLLYTRKWYRLFSVKVLGALLIFALTIAPMLYAYYQQFDLHPEKVIRGRDQRSGIFFILWEQSFERLSGEGVGKNSSDFFFFYHTLLWTVLPWTFVMLAAFYGKGKELIQFRFRYQNGRQLMAFVAFFVLLFLISFAQFKLPHYLNVLIPLVALITGGFLITVHNHKKERLLKTLLILQYVVFGIVLLASVLLLFAVFGMAPWHILVIFTVLFTIGLLLWKRQQQSLWRLVVVGVMSSVLLNLVMNGHFYPELLKYQGGLQLAKMGETQGIPKDQIFKASTVHSWDLDFYNKRPTPYLDAEGISEKLEHQDVWLYATEKSKETLETQFEIVEEVKAADFRITRLSLKFLNAEKRPSQLKYKYLLRVQQKD